MSFILKIIKSPIFYYGQKNLIYNGVGEQLVCHFSPTFPLGFRILLNDFPMNYRYGLRKKGDQFPRSPS
jgi:hypothetical protein